MCRKEGEEGNKRGLKNEKKILERKKKRKGKGGGDGEKKNEKVVGERLRPNLSGMEGIW